MATTFLEPGGDATFAKGNPNGFWRGGVNGSPVIATDFVHGSHIKSMQYRPSNPDFLTAPFGTLVDAGGRISLYIYLAALPTTTRLFLIIEQSGGSNVFSLQLTSTGVLRLYNGNNTTQLGSDGLTLATGAWYRLSIAYTITSTTINEFRIFANGVLTISVSNATLTRVSASTFQIGNFSSDTTLDFRSSDHYADDSNSLIDTGDIWVTAKRPNANGTLNEFTTQVGAGGSGYGSGHSPQVNERPLSTTNAWSISTTTKKTEEYSIEAADVGDINLTGTTIIDYMGWISTKVDSIANSPVHNLILVGNATAKTLSTTDTTYTQAAGSNTYPTGNTDIGMDAQYTTTAHTTILNECGIMVAYIPSTARFRTLLGVGQI